MQQSELEATPRELSPRAACRPITSPLTAHEARWGAFDVWLCKESHRSADWIAKAGQRDQPSASEVIPVSCNKKKIIMQNKNKVIIIFGFFSIFCSVFYFACSDKPHTTFTVALGGELICNNNKRFGARRPTLSSFC